MYLFAIYCNKKSNKSNVSILCMYSEKINSALEIIVEDAALQQILF